MEQKFLESGYRTPTNMSQSDLTLQKFETLSPTDSNCSIRKLQRKPDTAKKRISPKSKKEGLSTIFAGFYSPKQFNKMTQNSERILTANILRESNGKTTRRENTENSQSKQTTIEMLCRASTEIFKKSSLKEFDKLLLKQNKQKSSNFQDEPIIARNKKLEKDILTFKRQNQQLQQKISQLTECIRDLNKRLQNRERQIQQYQMRQKGTLFEISKLRHHNISLHQNNVSLQNQRDVLDRKYLQIQIQVRKTKDIKKKDSSQLLQKIATLEKVVKEKQKDIYKLVVQNQKLKCQTRIKQQRIYELESYLNLKKDALLQQTNKKLRMVNKQLMYRVNNLLVNSRDYDISFELSPQK